VTEADSETEAREGAYSRSEFEPLMALQRAPLRLHCYRMLGSSHDSDDMVQETYVRALRSLHTLSDPGAARGWLYRIATNVCLDELRKRPARRARGPELGPPNDPEQAPPSATADDTWLEPFPSSWLAPATATALDPAAQYTLKESVALAFVAALQVLTPAQRAVLLLRDVVGLSAEETSHALECSLSAANSTLHRARAALEERVGARASGAPEQTPEVDRKLLARYLKAWESGDLSAIIALLHAEVTLSMPPIPFWVFGRDAVGRFFTNRIQQAVEAHRFRAVAVEASGGIGVGFYRVEADGQAHFFALQVLEVREGQLAVIDHFMGQASHAAFFADGLTRVIPAAR
jgi:RNA polymerase sigma-70 factor (ECF subfamily)